MEFDIKDVARIAELEAKARAFVRALEAAEPAFERLAEAEYPGAEAVIADTENGSIYDLLESLEDARTGNGDLGAWLYQVECRRYGQTVSETVKKLWACCGGPHDFERIAALHHYAASVA